MYNLEQFCINQSVIKKSQPVIISRKKNVKK